MEAIAWYAGIGAVAALGTYFTARAKDVDGEITTPLEATLTALTIGLLWLPILVFAWAAGLARIGTIIGRSARK